MKITYDPQVDALFIQLRDAEASHVVDIEPGVTAAIGRDGHILGLEVLDATERLGGQPPSSVTLEWLAEEQPDRAEVPWPRTAPPG
ncbi:MAG: DUF2283 domain-containing protein [Candidatus Xenobia bacterium]